MKLSAITMLVLLCCVSGGCLSKHVKSVYLRMEEKAYPFYLDYFHASPEAALAGIRKVEQIALAAKPEVWEQMDQGTYMSFVHGRLSLALARAGNLEEAKNYRALAIRDFQRRKEWNYEYQAMLPVTPSPSREAAEQRLFAMIEKLDEHFRNKKNSGANQHGGANGRRPSGSETNGTSAAAASRRSP